MTSEQQKRMVQELARFRTKMNAQEREKYDMMVKRQKDDEDFDSLTQNDLESLYNKFLKKHSKDELNRRWDQLFS